MKRVLAVALVMALVFAAPVFALAEGELPVGVFTRVSDGEVIDLDGDGTKETIGFTHENNEENGKFTVSLNDQVITSEGEAWDLTGEIYAVRFENVAGAFLLVSDYGPSSDDTSFIYHYYVDFDQKAQFYAFATVGAMPENMTVTGGNTFTTSIRAAKIMTWFRPADYVIATSYNYTNDGAQFAYALAEVPRDIYPMGAYVTLTRDLPLLASRDGDEIAMTMQAGEKAIIAGTNDVDWIYITPEKIDYSMDPFYAGGWVRMGFSGWDTLILPDGTEVSAGEIMQGLLYAD